MAKPQNLEVYRDWLGITETARPLNYYQLLRLKKFEDDTASIRSHFQRMNAHVRKFQAIEPERVQALLDELTKAMLCLTDSRRKGDYDGTLGRTGSSDRKKHSLEDILLTRKIVDQEQLKKAQNMANAIGVDLRDALMQQKLAKPEVVMQAYADSLGLPFLDLSLIQINPELVPKMPAVLARQHSCVPLLIDDEKVIVASPNPLRQEVEDEVRLRFGIPVRTVLCTPADIHEAISKHFPKEAAAAQIGVALPAGGSAQPTKPKMDPAERLKRRKQFAMVGGLMPAMLFMVLGSTIAFGTSHQTLSAQWTILWFYPSAFLVAGVGAGIGWIVGGRG
jgi:hypothetical protein